MTVRAFSLHQHQSQKLRAEIKFIFRIDDCETIAGTREKPLTTKTKEPSVNRLAYSLVAWLNAFLGFQTTGMVGRSVFSSKSACTPVSLSLNMIHLDYLYL